MGESGVDPIGYHWGGSFTNDEVNTLHAEAFGKKLVDNDWKEQVDKFSLGWVTARDDDGLVGFVNVIWDGRLHAFIEDTMVAVRARRQGVGVRLIELARVHSAEAGCEWLHVDFEDRLKSFYVDACGFAPTTSGLIMLR